MMPSISDEEILTSISIPVWKNPHGYAFIEFARRHGDFAVCENGTLVEIDTNDIKQSSNCGCRCRCKPLRLSTLESDLIGKRRPKILLNMHVVRQKIEAFRMSTFLHNTGKGRNTSKKVFRSS